MLDDAKGKVIWFVWGLVAVGIAITVIVSSMTEVQEFFASILKKTENY